MERKNKHNQSWFDKHGPIYVENGGDYCPFCVSPNIEMTGPTRYDDETMAIYKDNKCVVCGNKWTDVYKLTKVIGYQEDIEEY